ESPVEPGIDVAGFERKAVVEIFNGITMPAKEKVSRGAPAVRLGIVQTKLDPLSVGFHGFLRLTQSLKRPTQGIVNGGGLEPETGRFLPVASGVGKPAQGTVDVSSERQRLRIAGL